MNGQRGRAVSGAFVFLLLGVFAVFATLLVLLGARAYQTTVARSEQHAAAQVLENFVANAVRADDAAGAVSVETVDGMDVLHIVYDFDGELYDKWVYCRDGRLRELFTSRENGFDAEAGEPICAAQDMKLSRSGSLITAELTDTDGYSHRSQIALRCAG